MDDRYTVGGLATGWANLYAALVIGTSNTRHFCRIDGDGRIRCSNVERPQLTTIRESILLYFNQVIAGGNRDRSCWSHGWGVATQDSRTIVRTVGRGSIGRIDIPAEPTTKGGICNGQSDGSVIAKTYYISQFFNL